ncbi:MAG: TolC family protein [Bacteroidetes bacterium]|nr:TolC family protein [Bacteroidota bacterium]
MKSIPYILLCSLTLFLSAQEQVETLSFSLEEAKEYALQNSYKIQIAKFDVTKTTKKVNETTTIGLPQVSAEVGYTNFLDLATQLIPAIFFNPEAQEGEFAEVQFGTKHNANWNITVSQLIFSGEYIVGLQTSKAYLNLSKYNLIKSENDLLEQVANAYYVVLVSERNKSILDSILISIKETLYETEQFYKEGLIEDTDVDQIRIMVSDLETNNKIIEDQIKIAYKYLKFMMGMKTIHQLLLTDSLENIVNNIEEFLILNRNFNHENHIDFLMLKNQSAIAELNLKLEKSGYLPTLSAFYSYEKNAMNNDFTILSSSQKWYPTSMVGLQISVPIYNSGLKHFKVQQAKLDIEKLDVSKTELSEGLDMQIEQLRIDYKNAWFKHNNKNNNLNLSKKIYNKTQIKYIEGISTSLELSQTYSQYLNTETTYITSILDLLKAKSALEKMLNKN